MKPRRIIWGSTLVKPESWSVNCPCSTCTTSRDLKNQQADALARIASLVEGLTPRTIICEVLDQPSINSLQVHTINRTDTWIEEIIGYLRDRLLPSEEKEAGIWRKMWGGSFVMKVICTKKLTLIPYWSMSLHSKAIISLGKFMNEPPVATRGPKS